MASQLCKPAFHPTEPRASKAFVKMRSGLSMCLFCFAALALFKSSRKYV